MNVLRTLVTINVPRQTCTASLKLFRSTASVKGQAQKAPVKHHKQKEVSTEVTFGEKIKEGGKTGSYFAVILGGIGVTGYILYMVFSELFSRDSPNYIYDKAFKEVLQNSKVQDMLGEPIKAHGETSSRGRRRHVQHGTYMKDGVEHLVVKFYIVGSRRRATVHVDMKKNDQNKYDYHVLAVELKDFPRETILVRDGRPAASQFNQLQTA